ncbi:hypothetical protein H5410_052508 [Solanum commersonii]|uniref:Uncharacterized protein n=1 Tax=Solanum commersonii TaxID=4109 RepID=A0A9J5X105_SOLCO|nr:hypothetical protein H5410_052508 [Solanum commersonii]
MDDRYLRDRLLLYGSGLLLFLVPISQLQFLNRHVSTPLLAATFAVVTMGSSSTRRFYSSSVNRGSMDFCCSPWIFWPNRFHVTNSKLARLLN